MGRVLNGLLKVPRGFMQRPPRSASRLHERTDGRHQKCCGKTGRCRPSASEQVQAPPERWVRASTLAPPPSAPIEESKAAPKNLFQTTPNHFVSIAQIALVHDPIRKPHHSFHGEWIYVYFQVFNSIYLVEGCKVTRVASIGNQVIKITRSSIF